MPRFPCVTVGGGGVRVAVGEMRGDPVSWENLREADQDNGGGRQCDVLDGGRKHTGR